MVAARWVRYGGLLLAGLLTGIVSYEHLHSLLAARAQGAIVSLIGPLAIDGIMAMATMGLVLTAIRRSDSADVSGVPVSVVTADELDRELDVLMSEELAPAPVKAPRASRAKYDWREVAEMAMNGEAAKELHAKLGVGLSTAGRYTRVARMLREDATTIIDSAAERVHEDHVAFMRSMARVAR